LELAAVDVSIQGFHGGVFWERNTLSEQRKGALPRAKRRPIRQHPLLFDPE
jgi:hypothetical protein